MPKVYTIKVTLLGWLVDQGPGKRRTSITRTLEVRGDQDLEVLHRAVFRSFDRDDSSHLYEFRFATAAKDRKSTVNISNPFFGARGRTDTRPPETLLDELHLEVGDRFWYLFDFGDNWEHKLVVRAVGEADPDVTYPRMTEAKGDSPPQYEFEDWDEDEDEDEDWDDEEPEEE